jgi:hypothetical protein
MKQVYLVGFRGTGFRDSRFIDQDPLIRAGHVGIAFEGYEGRIIGFHPTPEAVERVGGNEKVIEKLKSRDKTNNTLEGMLQEDYDIFRHAYELAQRERQDDDPDTTVFQYAIELPDAEFERILHQVMTWYNEGETFLYAFPIRPLMDDRDNCATFPRRLGLPVLDDIGQIRDYVAALKQRGEVWTPGG